MDKKQEGLKGRRGERKLFNKPRVLIFSLESLVQSFGELGGIHCPVQKIVYVTAFVRSCQQIIDIPHGNAGLIPWQGEIFIIVVGFRH